MTSFVFRIVSPECVGTTTKNNRESLLQDVILSSKLISPAILILFYFLFYLFLEGKGGRKGRETSMCGCLTSAPYSAHNPGMRPDWELNWRPFGSQAGAQSTEPHQPSEILILNKFL